MATKVSVMIEIIIEPEVFDSSTGAELRAIMIDRAVDRIDETLRTLGKLNADEQPTVTSDFEDSIRADERRRCAERLRAEALRVDLEVTEYMRVPKSVVRVLSTVGNALRDAADLIEREPADGT